MTLLVATETQSLELVQLQVLEAPRHHPSGADPFLFDCNAVTSTTKAPLQKGSQSSVEGQRCNTEHMPWAHRLHRSTAPRAHFLLLPLLCSNDLILSLGSSTAAASVAAPLCALLKLLSRILLLCRLLLQQKRHLILLLILLLPLLLQQQLPPELVVPAFLGLILFDDGALLPQGGSCSDHTTSSACCCIK
jgi:hypothetical protein